ncbi:hypothetical protein JL721_328 [Aureococcus anophagefferens]|nr:hypothetical protein JL721_328 [Aureococcus anophagefferens]
MDIEQTLENLTLNKGKLDYATILKLQETLADACRIHDETHADEMAAVLEKMRLRGSEGAADAAAPQPAYDFTSPGRGAASDAQWSPTPLGADGERSVERAMFGSAFSPAKRVSPETPVFVFGTPVAAPAARRSTASMDVDDEPPPPPPAVPPPPAAVPGVFAVGAPPPAPPAPKATKNARSPAPQSALSDAAEPQSVLPPEDAPMDEDGGPTFSEGPTFTVGTQSPDRKPASAKKKRERRRSRVDAPKDPGALEWYERAGREYEGGDYDGATRSYGVALKLAVPGWALAAKALGNRGAALTMLGKHEEALEDCDAAVELEPTLAKVHNRSARLRLALGLPKAASRSFERARDAAKRLVDDARLRGSAAPHDALNALQTADAGLVDVERYKDALRRCGAALDGARQKAREAGAANDENAGPALFPGKGDESPTTPDEPRRHGSAAKKRRDARRAAYDADCDRALKAAEDALLRAPLSRDARLAKASALHRLDKWRECAEFCETCATTAARPKGGAEDDRGRAARAPDAACDGAKSPRTALAAAAATSPGPSPEERRARTRCELELNRATKTRRAKVRADDAYARGHYRAAAAMYKDALRLDAFDELDGLRAAIHCNVAACALVLDRGAEAADHCSKALRLRPGYLRARLRRALSRRPTTSRRRRAPPRRPPSSWRRRDDKPKPHARPASSSAGVAAKASHHAVLGVASDAPPGVVKKAYAKLALKFHPDRNDSPGATAAMARINEAYEKAMEAANSRHR